MPGRCHGVIDELLLFCKLAGVVFVLKYVVVVARPQRQRHFVYNVCLREKASVVFCLIVSTVSDNL